ncbi:MAG: 4Fe-4S dicluster domain-containing protein [Nitrospirota bacterium]
MDCDRREFLKVGFKTLLATGVSIGAFELLKPEVLAALNKEKGLRWVFVVDTTKCVGCGMCVRACKLENEVPYETNVSRTWVERYVMTKDGKILVDSPKAARDGFIKNDPMGVTVKKEDIDKAFFVPKLCNQCEAPPCVQVCPVGATYQAPDGVVLVDRTWCIGCGYCIMACPYGVRFFHPLYRVAEKCNFCYHRINKGMKTACVDACAFGARQIGNIKDLEDPVARIIKTERTAVLKEEFGTKPHVFYIGLDSIVR